MGGVIRWEEPPPAGGPGRPHEWLEVSRTLEEHPGRWALVEVNENKVTALNHARSIRWLSPKGAFDAVSRSAEDGYRVYARYVGEAP